MELQQFVRDTICQVILGIDGAKQILADRGIGAAVNPVWEDANNLNDEHVLKMEFDVAVAVASTTQSEAGGGLKLGIQVLSVGAGVKDQNSTEHSSVSRVKFVVPYILPATAVTRSLPRIQAVSDYNPAGF